MNRFGAGPMQVDAHRQLIAPLPHIVRAATFHRSM